MYDILSPAQAGKPLSSEIRRIRPTHKLVENISRSIRTDFGGKDAIESIKKKTGITDNDIAKKVLILIKENNESIRARTKHDREEILRRCSETPDSLDNSVYASKDRTPIPSPTKSDIENPLFDKIWNAIKTWDINVPEYYDGYAGAEGGHVKLILDSIR